MSILDKLIETSRPTDRWSCFKSPINALTVVDNGPLHPSGFAQTNEFTLKAEIGITFTANQAQYRDARMAAERALIHRLYADMLSEVAEITHAVYNGDEAAALDACGRLKKAMEL